MYTEADYQRERAICDKAEAYARATMAGKRNYLTAEECAHPDYAECNNDMRGRVEAYELTRDKPDAFCAYVTGNPEVTTWPGNVLGRIAFRGNWSGASFGRAKWRQVIFRSVWGKVYYGREYNTMQLVRFRAYKNPPAVA